MDNINIITNYTIYTIYFGRLIHQSENNCARNGECFIHYMNALSKNLNKGGNKGKIFILCFNGVKIGIFRASDTILFLLTLLSGLYIYFFI